MFKLVVINGSGGVGKDTFVDLCKDYVLAKNVSTIDPIKVAAKMLGWNGEKDEAGRLALHELKVLATKHFNTSYKVIEEEISFLQTVNDVDGILFVHSREPEEIERFVKDFDGVSLLIKNSNVEQIKSNAADAGVYNYSYDYVIDNSGTISDLRDKALLFVGQLFLPEEMRRKIYETVQTSD